VALGLFVLIAVPSVFREVASFATDLPAKLEALMTRLEPALSAYGIPMPATLDEASEAFREGAQDLASRAIAPAGALLQWIVGGTASLLGTLVGLITVPVFAFYLLYDFDRLTESVRGLIPRRAASEVVAVFRDIDAVLSQFIRGQVTVMAILAALYAVGYSIAGVRLAIVIGLLGGFLSFIPYVGGAVAVGLALLMVVLDGGGVSVAIAVAGVWAGVQLLEGFVITPKIVGDKVGLSAVWVLLALMVAGHIFGFMGVLLAVPAAAVVKILVTRGIVRYRASELFLAGGAATGAPMPGGSASADPEPPAPGDGPRSHGPE
jgi:predicted PurR-regulated permease PerM